MASYRTWSVGVNAHQLVRSGSLSPVYLQAAVDGEALSCDIVGLVGREIEDEPRHLPWLAGTAPGDARHLFRTLRRIVGPLLGHRRPDQAGSDGIDVYAL